MKILTFLTILSCILAMKNTDPKNLDDSKKELEEEYYYDEEKKQYLPFINDRSDFKKLKVHYRQQRGAYQSLYEYTMSQPRVQRPMHQQPIPGNYEKYWDWEAQQKRKHHNPFETESSQKEEFSSVNLKNQFDDVNVDPNILNPNDFRSQKASNPRVSRQSEDLNIGDVYDSEKKLKLYKWDKTIRMYMPVEHPVQEFKGRCFGEVRQQMYEDGMDLDNCVNYCFDLFPEEPPAAVSFALPVQLGPDLFGGCACHADLKLVAYLRRGDLDWTCAVNIDIYDTSKEAEDWLYQAEGKTFHKKTEKRKRITSEDISENNLN